MSSDVVSNFDQWLDTVTTAFVPLSSEPIGRGADFSGTLSTSEFGNLQVARVRATPHVVWRSSRDLNDNSASDVKISFVVSGSATIEQGGTQATLQTGSAALYHCDTKYRLTMNQPFDQIVLQIDRRELEELIALPSGLPIRLESQNVFMRCLRSLASELTLETTGPAEHHDNQLLGAKMLDFLALAISGSTDLAPASGPTRRELYVRALVYIRQHLGDPTLSPTSVAGAIGLSRRSLYSLFAQQDQTVADFIITARLDRAHKHLQDTHGHGGSVAQVAFACGFKSPAHFSRRFTERFGRSPSELRKHQTDL